VDRRKKKMIAILIAIGANDLSIPCRIFENMEIAKQRCDEIFGTEGEWIENAKQFAYIIDPEERDDLSNELFTKHYYGCGSPWMFALQEIDFDTKFVGWDLD
jgi:hypothetical protein